ncbi:zinc finger protein 555-like [Ostrinia nubilalis]|uniref:zinc finger protein 555-like n=1 Tax=Ostrinia nubilalis TaxID=29057 RepID=UPI0030822ECE
MEEVLKKLLSKAGLSTLICNECITRLRDACSFRILVFNTERQLLEALDSGQSDILNQDTVKQEFSSTVSVKEEITSNGECSEEESSKYNMCEVIYNTPPPNNDLVEGESKLIARFTSLKPLLKRVHLKKICPNFVKRLEALKGKHISGKSLERLLQTDTEKLKGNLKTVPNDQLNEDLNEPFTKKKRIQTTKYKEKDKLDIDRLKNPYTIERLTHATNITAILEFSNVTAFKSKFQRAYPCFYCEKLFEDFEELKKHQKSDHTKENVSQSVLKKYRVGRPDGVVVYADISDLQCTICSKSIQSLNDLKKHLTEVHGKKMYLELSDRVIPFKVKENSFQCQLCGNLYETFGAIERHMNTHYRNYVCEECDSGFVSKQRLRIHGYHMHSRRTKQYPCEVCQKQFPSQQKRKIHVETVHENVKKYKCNRCPERFNEYFRRHKHMVLVHGVAPLEYKCNICEKSFERPYALSIHMRTHIQQKDIYCEICPYRCFTNVELRHHMIKHNGKRIHECSVCKKSYAREKTLKEHMRIHTNDRRYVCPVCGQAFIQNCSLKSHIRSHHKDYGLT